MLTNCSVCGAPLSSDALFCSKCGGNITEQFAVVSAASLAEGPSPAARVARALSDRYRVVRKLGEGGMAVVLLARDIKHDRDVAIKVLHPELGEAIDTSRFEREIKLIAGLHHPNILALHDSGVADGLLYYVMPFVEGESLRDRLEREGQLPVDEAIRIALEVASALGYAHSKGIVHRDIKPENILMSGDHTLLADFGIARAKADHTTPRLTQTGMAMGTPLYMAPEQTGGDVVGPTADIYALGCVLYEMLAGEPPFTGKSPVQIMARHAMEQVPSVRIVRSTVPEQVEEAIFHAMAKVPADRPQSAAQFAELLGIPLMATASMRALAGRRTPSGVQRTFVELPAPRPWWRSPRVMAAAAVVAVVASLGVWRWSTVAGSGDALGANARRVAVLYFEDRSRDRSLAALADGLTDGLIRALSTAPSLTVISQSGVESFRATTASTDSIARALRAGFLVRGYVEPERGQVRVAVSLDDESGVNLHRASFVRAASSVTAIQDTLTALVSDLLKTQLRQEIEVRERRARTSSAGAWLLVQRGEQARRRADAATEPAERDRAFADADSLFAVAESQDARWSEPPTRRALLAYRRSRLVGRDPALVRPFVQLGMGHANRAVALEPANADALEVRGNLQYWGWLVGIEADPARAQALLEAAQRDLERSVEVNPRQAGAYATLSHLYYQNGTNSDVNIAAQRALEADEFLANADVILGRLFLSSYDLGQFDKAGQWCTELRRRFPSHVMAVRCQLFLLTTRSRPPDVSLAWRLADSVISLTAAPMRELQRRSTHMLVAAVLARAGRDQPALRDSAARVARRSEGDATLDGTRDLSYLGAFVYTLLGDRANAFRTLKDYVAANPQRARALRNDPGWWFRELESDERFRLVVGTAD